MIKLCGEDICDLALGAKLMGGGGGGDTYPVQLMAQEAIRRHGPVRVWEVDEVPADALVIGVGLMGGTTVHAERLPSDEEAVQAVRGLERYLGRPAAAMISIEMAGINGVIPAIPTAQLGLPLVDADLMGRAFPGIHMTLATVAGLRVTPMVIVDALGSQVIIDVPDNMTAEALARSVVMDMGGTAHMAIYPMTGAEMRRVALPGTLSHRVRIGCTLREVRDQDHDPVPAILTSARGVELFRGKVTHVERRWPVGYDYAFGSAAVEGAGAYMGQEMTLKCQNEYLIAAIGRHLVATVPDNIVVLEARTTDPIPPEFLVPGMDLIVLGIPCAEGWRTPEGLAIAGPRAFGYDLDYRSLALDSENRAEGATR